MPYIGELSSLKYLRFNFIKFLSTDFAYLDKLENLEELDTELGSHGIDLARSKVLPHLLSLSISNCSTISPVIEKLTHSNKLRTLSFSGVTLSAYDCKNICAIENLEKLHLGRLQLTNQNLKQLANATTLKELDVCQISTITTKGLDDLVKMKGLRKLALPDKVLTVRSCIVVSL
ncbi:hypothetical protein BH11CYA1_BH11CYA1_50970 [soil metagenome]